MASGRITIDVGLETRGVAKGAKDAERALKDLEDAAGDAGRDGGRDLDKMEDELKDVQRQSRDTGRDIGRDIGDGFDKAKKGADEFKDESRSTAREAAASFDGSAESIGDAFQEVAANAFGGFGPAGEAAGLAIAAGIGTGIAAIQNAHEKTDELKEGIRELYQEAAEEGRTFLSEAQIQSETIRIMFEDQTKLREEANRLGIDTVTLARAYAGDQEAANTAIQLGNEKLAEREEQDRKNLETLGAKPQKVDLESEAIRQVITLLEEQQGWHEQNRQAAEDVANAQKQQGQYIADAGQKLRDIASNKYSATLDLNIRDNTGRQVERIVNRINGKVASIQVSAGIGGKQIL